MWFDSLAWLTTQFVLCRKSTDLSWEGEEPDVAAAEEDPPAAVEESASLPQVETIAQGAEATPPEATVLEGMYISMTSFASGGHSPRVLTLHVL
jgi:alpha-D-ribose 1-methylphosphonate 5-triphosphate synthase subunit PhnH